MCSWSKRTLFCCAWRDIRSAWLRQRMKWEPPHVTMKDKDFEENCTRTDRTERKQHENSLYEKYCAKKRHTESSKYQEHLPLTTRHVSSQTQPKDSNIIKSPSQRRAELQHRASLVLKSEPSHQVEAETNRVGGSLDPLPASVVEGGTTGSIYCTKNSSGIKNLGGTTNYSSRDSNWLFRKTSVLFVSIQVLDSLKRIVGGLLLEELHSTTYVLLLAVVVTESPSFSLPFEEIKLVKPCVKQEEPLKFGVVSRTSQDCRTAGYKQNLNRQYCVCTLQDTVCLDCRDTLEVAALATLHEVKRILKSFCISVGSLSWSRPAAASEKTWMTETTTSSSVTSGFCNLKEEGTSLLSWSLLFFLTVSLKKSITFKITINWLEIRSRLHDLCKRASKRWILLSSWSPSLHLQWSWMDQDHPVLRLPQDQLLQEDHLQPTMTSMSSFTEWVAQQPRMLQQPQYQAYLTIQVFLLQFIHPIILLRHIIDPSLHSITIIIWLLREVLLRLREESIDLQIAICHSHLQDILHTLLHIILTIITVVTFNTLISGLLLGHRLRRPNSTTWTESRNEKPCLQELRVQLRLPLLQDTLHIHHLICIIIITMYSFRGDLLWPTQMEPHLETMEPLHLEDHLPPTNQEKVTQELPTRRPTTQTVVLQEPLPRTHPLLRPQTSILPPLFPTTIIITHPTLPIPFTPLSPTTLLLRLTSHHRRESLLQDSSRQDRPSVHTVLTPHIIRITIIILIIMPIITWMVILLRLQLPQSQPPCFTLQSILQSQL